jgi:heme/copper-type cytochrome/quinol oxidase subunit 3
LNTLVLLTSGVTITRAHILILMGNWRLSNCMMDTTILLGIFFLMLQYSEYLVASFSISDGIYGSVFFMLTGFHGFHVLVGTIFLLISKVRLYFKKIFVDDHLSFEVAS